MNEKDSKSDEVELESLKTAALMTLLNHKAFARVVIALAEVLAGAHVMLLKAEGKTEEYEVAKTPDAVALAVATFIQCAISDVTGLKVEAIARVSNSADDANPETNAAPEQIRLADDVRDALLAR